MRSRSTLWGREVNGFMGLQANANPPRGSAAVATRHNRQVERKAHSKGGIHTFPTVVGSTGCTFQPQKLKPANLTSGVGPEMSFPVEARTCK
ncbi:unnamed protein product [Protopolystoma xenopodis]|uniref:Uncharacterized protein n=1 Tax=Protopolystoma xenopodis TaxID=117903 RepID=A0A448WUN2_9PLAT|nr:unnamed protein product [Protopolystoma xenopodis]